MKRNKNHLKWGITAFLVILASLISYYAIFHLDSLTGIFNQIIVILMPVIDGLIIAYLLTPLLNVLERRITKPLFKLLPFEVKWKTKRMFSILITFAITFFAFYVFFAMIIPQITTSIRTIIEQFPSYINTLTVWINKIFSDNPNIGPFVNDLLSRYSINIGEFVNSKVIPQINTIIRTVSVSVYSAFKEIWNLIIGFIISIYLLGSKERFAAQAKKIVYAFFSLDTSNRFISNVRFANKTFGGFFVGKIIDSIIIGILCFICTSLMGTPFNVLISVIVGVTNVIPFFGPFLGAIPSTLLVLFIDPLQALYFVIFVFLLQQVDGNIIGPKILGSSTGLSSFWVIFSITLFGGIWGILGMVVGVPIFAVIFASIKSLTESRLKLKELPAETAKYLQLLYIKPEELEMVNFSEEDEKPFSQITEIQLKVKNVKHANSSKIKGAAKNSKEEQKENAQDNE